MTSDTTSKSLLNNIKKTWGMLTGFAVFIFGVVGSFVLPPPGWAAAVGDGSLVSLARFIVAALAGLVLILAHKWQRRGDVARWTALALCSLALAVLAYFAYQHFLDTRTCKYFEEAVVIGDTYTPQGQSYAARAANTSCGTLLEDFAGKAEDIWTRDSINGARRMLALSYLSCMPLFTVCIIAVVQALYCVGRNGRRGAH